MTTRPKPLYLQLMQRCVHFNGLINDSCRAGVVYADLKDEAVRPYGYPCFRDRPCSTVCDRAQFMTEAEARAEEERSYAELRRYFVAIGDGRCPICDAPMQQRQVGPCVYANPCGHRLYQGRIE